ncbi:MAG: DNA-binding protein WhiA [Lachnospiraceae bacterium]
MSFSTKVKEEIGKHLSRSRHCQIAELLALVLATGEVSFQDGQLTLLLRPENDLIQNKICLLIDILFDKKIDYVINEKNIVISDRNMADHVLQTIKLSDYVDYLEEDWLDEEELSLIEEDEITYVSSHAISLQNCQFPKQVIQKNCCKKAFLRGIFLATGSVSDPSKAYHFEIVVRNKDMAVRVQEVVRSFALDAKIAKRKKYYIVYLKEGAMIVDMLKVMEASVNLMEMENVLILKEMRNDINRRVNCETANIKKTVNAARRQIDDIEYIEKTKGLKYLNSSLREVAQLRLEEPDANLSELGEMLNPPVSKSGVNHRLRKISEIARELRENNRS